jgi:alkylation response protein AidB-like acyl-CoA dehydrogenase
MTMTEHHTDQPTLQGTTDWSALARETGKGLRPFAAENDRTGQLPAAAFDALKAAGLTGALAPSEFGGGGASHAEMGQILRELGQCDPAVAVTLSMHSHLVAAQVWRHKHGIDAEKVLRKVGEDRAILISTGASDWIPSNGTANKVEGGFRVSARKGPASGCEVGDILVTSIRWNDAPDGAQVLHCAVPFSAEGVSIELTWDTLGMRATGSHTVVLNDVFVPDAAVALARPADRWHPVWNTVMGAAMPLIMSAYLGVADSAVELAIAAVSGRSEPHVIQLLGEMMNAHTTAADLIAAMYIDTDNLQFANTDELASRILSRKTVASDALIETVRLAIEVTGGVGYTRSSDIERLYRDVHGCLFHPLGRAKQTHLTGRVALGLSPVG